MNVYPEQYNRRITSDEIVEYARKRSGVSLVEGLAEIVDEGGAVANRGRVAGFMETHDLREWVLPLDAEEGLNYLETTEIDCIVSDYRSQPISCLYHNFKQLVN